MSDEEFAAFKNGYNAAVTIQEDEKKGMKKLFPVIEGNESFGAMLICPKCDFDYVHFEKPIYKDGSDDYIAWEGRGEAVEIKCWCENGHKWTMRLGFHKGNSYIKNIDIKEIEEPKSVKEQSEKEVEAIAFYKQGFDAGRNGEQFDHRKAIKMVEKLNELKGLCRYCGSETREQDFDGSLLENCTSCGYRGLPSF